MFFIGLYSVETYRENMLAISVKYTDRKWTV